ncbi:3-hydroxy-3-methylglutaryl-CoA reductase [Perkinsela sp. CCAP 1560/4]|nr:3-hydroxy-3-methylglutaryl-CoA reductase [Perkinsela sp. CCAP 1560/4]|eukprot:KNH05476.1 3-hydroxy-3-methylglutaryl-CoA reductase [Perkinsela sp. CCAP 1560/4]
MKILRQKKLLDNIQKNTLSLYQLEKVCAPDYDLAIRTRRAHITRTMQTKHCDPFAQVPLSAQWAGGENFWESIHGSNCENVVGFVPLPVGVVGPVPMAGGDVWVPMATTEGALIASTNRGASAIRASKGFIEAVVTKDSMTRAPIVGFPSFRDAIRFKRWCATNLRILQVLFEETTNHGKLQAVDTVIVGANVFMRFQCATGEAMGMNMVTKGVDYILHALAKRFPKMRIRTVSGNYCSDKKLTAVNWINGRGKTVCASVEIDSRAVQKVLKTDIHSLIDLHTHKNLVGSALAGALGGYNAHAANIVAGVFLATGQDAAQVVESSACLTHFEAVHTTCRKKKQAERLRVSVTMPCVEVGTIGGGTRLRPQHALLNLLLTTQRGRRSRRKGLPIDGTRAQVLAKTIAATVLCGELSLLAAQAAGHLTQAHMRLNRK